jgi:hypothetical protein
LHAAHGSQFFTDAPVALLPASWQDTGSGTFALALAAVGLAAGPLAAAPSRRAIGLALLCGLVAFLVALLHLGEGHGRRVSEWSLCPC